MGWPSEFFVSGAPREMFTCKICLDVLDDPMDANCDEQHVFCRTCLDGWFDARPDGAACPTCNEGLRRDAVRPAKSIRRLVGELHASCQYGKDGCDWTGALSNRADHIAQCPLALRQCRGCEAECRLKDLQAHEAACDKVRRPCPNADIGCPDEVTDPEREEHLRTCRQRGMLFSRAILRTKDIANPLDSPSVFATLRRNEARALRMCWSFETRVAGR
eukprot:tig00021489_g21691.t1